MDPSIYNEIHKLEPSTLITLYEIVLKDHGASYYFHAGENGLNTEIEYQGNSYYYVPIQAEGFDSTDSSLPRPTVTIDNHDSFFSLKTRFFKDFVGYSFKRTRTFVKFLSGNNFPNGVNPYGTPTEVSFPVEKYVVNKKILENQNVIQLELASPLEKENAFIPSRKIVYNTCQWRYRSNIGCGYNGIPQTDGKGNLVNYDGLGVTGYDPTINYRAGVAVSITAPPDSQDVDKIFVCLQDDTSGDHPVFHKDKWVLDTCSKNISGCRLRFGAQERTNGLPFGGFPGTWEY